MTKRSSKLSKEEKAKILKVFYPSCAADIPRVLHGNMEKVLNGTLHDKEYILSNIEFAGMQILEGRCLYDELREFIGNALLSIGGGEDANVAFQLKSTRKRKSDDIVNARIAMRVLYVIEVYGLGTDPAFQVVGKAEHKSAGQIKKIYYKYNKQIRDELGIS